MPCACTSPTDASVCTVASFRPLPVPPTTTTASTAASVNALARPSGSAVTATPPMDPMASATQANAASIKASPLPRARTRRNRGVRTRTAVTPAAASTSICRRWRDRPASSSVVPAGSIARRLHAVTGADGASACATPSRTVAASSGATASASPASAPDVDAHGGGSGAGAYVPASVVRSARTGPAVRSARAVAGNRGIRRPHPRPRCSRPRRTGRSHGGTGLASASIRASTSSREVQPDNPLRSIGFHDHGPLRSGSAKLLPRRAEAAVRRFNEINGREDHEPARAQMSPAGVARAQGADRTEGRRRPHRRCTDPLTAIDIPNLLTQTGDALELSAREGDVLVFRIRKN